MDVDCYRLAYNTFHHNLQRFGIPEKDIPPAKTEEVVSLNPIIPGFSKAVVFFQITSRSDLKTFFDECPRIHNLEDFYTRFENIMKKAFPERFIIMKDLPKGTIKKLAKDAVKEDSSEDAMMKDLSEVAMTDDHSEDTMETYLSEETTEEDLSENSKNESLPSDSKKKSLSKDGQKEILSENGKKESPPEDVKKGDNKIRLEEIPEIIAFSLAISTELILYQYEDVKQYMKQMPDIWTKFFNENLKGLCEEAGCTSEHLKTYSESIRCPDNFLNKFITENVNEYHDIEPKFRDYIKTNSAVASPEDVNFIAEFRNFPIVLSFGKMKARFREIVESCKCTKGTTAEEIPLLSDYSPCTPTSP